ncbi:Precorrin-6Y C(5,15)-methyltransferase (decarboxylating) [Candidatus Defluviicoccus seviourii]|uniref:Precorrin-6Y C(5,15)-methyltransferase (Decarboxylating) n=2 Tax=root TaxID=1 RepID=A0A564WGV8_9PROT|nr:Precorrin-6Y C(5,15)-methyltransferase (decarboxylating) [uncultured Defluviicoccus sp.]VUX46813.1 Precorrin-6Y C(5,15)-methyltransferase (decarboxylating) [Candidatus Defluviicoccus seviourii]
MTTENTQAAPRPWLTVIGIGDDGLPGISGAARALIDAAELLVGGERHLSMVPPSPASRLTWAGGVQGAVKEIQAWRGRRVVVLATGDPMWFGGGANLSRHFGADEMTVITHPGAFSLAAAAMLWSMADVVTLNAHSRPLAGLNLHIHPGARLLVLSRDGALPGEAAKLLTERGFGPSLITVLEHLGGPRERRFTAVAESWSQPRAADLNVLAIECRPGPSPRLMPPVPGLADDLFAHDGQLTKREVRALTISALAPLPGQVLWDIGAGAGSVAIEWLRAVPAQRLAGGEARAIAVEQDAARVAMIAQNALALGVPQLKVLHGQAPAVLADLERPDTIFLGGGLTDSGLIEACWQALPSGGRMVANAVSLEGQARLIALKGTVGGELTRLSVARAEPVGSLSSFRPLLDVTQFVGIKA